MQDCHIYFTLKCEPSTIFHAYWGLEQTKQYLKIIQKWGKNGITEKQHLNATGKVLRVGYRKKNIPVYISLCSRYNASTLPFLNLHYRSLTCKELGILLIYWTFLCPMYLIWSAQMQERTLVLFICYWDPSEGKVLIEWMTHKIKMYIFIDKIYTCI